MIVEIGPHVSLSSLSQVRTKETQNLHVIKHTNYAKKNFK